MKRPLYFTTDSVITPSSLIIHLKNEGEYDQCGSFASGESVWVEAKDVFTHVEELLSPVIALQAMRDEVSVTGLGKMEDCYNLLRRFCISLRTLGASLD